MNNKVNELNIICKCGEKFRIYYDINNDNGQFELSKIEARCLRCGKKHRAVFDHSKKEFWTIKGV